MLLKDTKIIFHPPPTPQRVYPISNPLLSAGAAVPPFPLVLALT